MSSSETSIDNFFGEFEIKKINESSSRKLISVSVRPNEYMIWFIFNKNSELISFLFEYGKAIFIGRPLVRDQWGFNQ